MVTDTQDTSKPNDPGEDPTFRENLRRQLRAKGAEGTLDPMENYIPMVQLDPAECHAVRWFGGVIGSLLFLFGGIWFLGILGYTVPWYAIFPILLMFIGGFLVAAGIATRKVLKKKEL
jgi:hypothetical protein